MNPRQTTVRVWRPALVASMTLGVWPGMAAAADAEADAQRDRTLRDIELRLEQQDAQREIAQRERMQREALRGQEESIRRLEEARRRLELSTREVTELSTELGRSYQNWAPSAVTPPPRALLGISVTEERRSDGALVRQVSPGGPAEEAGIRQGDLIVTLDGRDLTRESIPGRAVVEHMRRMEPEKPVQLEVLRDGNRMNFTVPSRAPAVAGAQPELRPRTGGGPPNLRVLPADPGVPGLNLHMGEQPASGIRLDGMEFATLSTRLGEYFGVTSGVLVVRAGPGAPFGLEDGDVILEIDGRVPATAQHAGRILRSYRAGEPVKLQVQRDRKPVTLAVTVPGR